MRLMHRPPRVAHCTALTGRARRPPARRPPPQLAGRRHAARQTFPACPTYPCYFMSCQSGYLFNRSTDQVGGTSEQLRKKPTLRICTANYWNKSTIIASCAFGVLVPRVSSLGRRGAVPPAACWRAQNY